MSTKLLRCLVVMMLAAGGLAAVAAPSSSSTALVSGRDQSIYLAPATVTVITRDQIERLGLRYLHEAIAAVPGFYVSAGRVNNKPIYVTRGAQRSIVLRDGVVWGSLTYAEWAYSWSSIPLANVERIEVIRGTGTALTPGESLVSVINIITRSDATPLTVGAFGYADVNDHEGAGVDAAQGGMIGNWTWRAVAHRERGDGASLLIQSDLQSRLDRATGTQASLAPGYANTDRNMGLVDLVLSSDFVRIGLQHELFDKMGIGVGLTDILDPQGWSTTENTRLTMEWSPIVARDHDFSIKAMIGKGYERHSTYTLSPGALLPLPGRTINYPDGQHVELSVYERYANLKVQDAFDVVNGHRMVIGLDGDFSELYHYQNVSNFMPDGTPTPYITFQDDASLLPPRNRRKLILFVQDEWAMTPDAVLTMGARKEWISDLDNSLCPKLALVYDFDYGLTGRITHGTGRHSPGLSDMYLRPTIVQEGNPDVRQERVRSTEVSLTKTFMPQVEMTMTVYKQDFDNLLLVSTRPGVLGRRIENVGKTKANGLELEGRADLGDWWLAGSWTWHDGVDRLTGTEAGYYPRELATLIVQRNLGNWGVMGQWQYVGQRFRPAGDSRPPINSMSILNVGLQWRPVQNTSLSIRVLNVADEEGRHPSISKNLEFDLPILRRTLELGIGTTF